MSRTSQTWWYVVARVLAAIVLGVIVGWLLENVWLGIALSLGAYLAWALATLFWVEWWLRHRAQANPPELSGLWGDLVAQIVRLHRRKRFHKQRLIQLFQQLRRSTAALPDGVVVLNTQREILWFNRTAASLLELRRSADLGLRIDNLLRQPEFVRYLDSGEFANAVVVRPDPVGERYLSLQIVPYGEGQQLLLVRDVSRQMELEAVRKDFIANASHELRSPLTVLSGYLETLAQDPSLQSELHGPLSEMRRQSARMTAIIRDLLELSRLEETDAEVSGGPIDVAVLMAQLRQDVLARSGATREVRVRCESQARLLGDQAEIQSAFFNLADNAAKYTPAEGSIELRWRTDADGGHFSVSDTGIGIQPEHIPRLTERFYRVDAGRSRATGGSGLGLAIVKHVLQRHGASLEIQSVHAQGSTFSCHFPSRRILNN